MATYPSSLTDTEWEILQPLLPQKADTMRGRPVENTRRAIIDGILYILRTGGAWRMMPNDLPHWKTCYHYFRLWAKLGYWERIHSALRDLARLASGKKKPRRLRLSIVKAFEQLASPEFVVMMRVRRLQEENDMYW
jgi:putative transposase